MPATTHDTILPFAFPAVRGRKITSDFDGGRLTSDGGVMLLAMAERRLSIADRLARLVLDRRDPARVTHTLADMIRARVFAIAKFTKDGATRTPTISITCATIQRSSSPADACPTAATISARSRPCRGSRTCRACAT